jgi:hypothetical protein
MSKLESRQVVSQHFSNSRAASNNYKYFECNAGFTPHTWTKNKTKINYLLQNFPLCLHGIVLLRLFGPCEFKVAFVLAKNVIKTFETKFDEKT